jgi:hypothetical protein
MQTKAACNEAEVVRLLKSGSEVAFAQICRTAQYHAMALVFSDLIDLPKCKGRGYPGERIKQLHFGDPDLLFAVFDF